MHVYNLHACVFVYYVCVVCVLCVCVFGCVCDEEKQYLMIALCG